MLPFPSRSIFVNISFTCSSVIGTPKCSSYPISISDLLRVPSPSISIALNILSKSRFSSSLVRWLAIKAKAACFNLDVPRKFLRLFNVICVMFLSNFSFDYSRIHLCCNASYALILYLGSYSNNLFTRSIASGVIDSHSSSSVRYFPSFTR